MMGHDNFFYLYCLYFFPNDKKVAIVVFKLLKCKCLVILLIQFIHQACLKTVLNFVVNSVTTGLSFHKYNCRVLKMCRRPAISPFTFTFSPVKNLSSMGFPTIFFLCELSLSRFVDLYLLIDYFYYRNQPNTNKSTIF